MAKNVTVILLGLVAGLLLLSGVAQASLSVGFYDHSCPAAEYIVRKHVFQAIKTNKNFAAALLRMHFHDCFVRGCDASVLLDPVNSDDAVEKLALPNFRSLRGFEIIDDIKASLEAACPGIVSCADILALASRDSVALVGGPFVELPTGRFDGVTSIGSETLTSLPPPIANLPVITSRFTAVGLTADDVVTLSGGHTIGQAHCVTFVGRLNPRDPVLNKKYAKKLLQACPIQGFSNTTLVFIDPTTPTRFDNKYYRNLLRGKGLFASDQVLFTEASTRPAVIELARSNRLFFRKFADALVRMGNISPLDASNGQIRKNCRVRNAA